MNKSVSSHTDSSAKLNFEEEASYQSSQCEVISVAVDKAASEKLDTIVIEEPLEIIINYQGVDEQGKPTRLEHSLAITMRTPGEDFYLVAGFLYNEGLITEAKQLVSMQHWGPKVGRLSLPNTVKVMLGQGAQISSERFNRHFVTNSSCGICGKSSLEALAVKPANPIAGREMQVSAEVLYQLNDKVKKEQQRFEQTGAIHASALLTSEGELHYLMEDVGRHNAMDKLVGYALIQQQLPLDELMVYFSGRLSFELVQKAVMAGIPFVVSVGAPTNSAIALAKEHDITVIGFLKRDRFNVYHGDYRVKI